MSTQRSYDVAIVGAGIMGAALAFGLAGRGQRVAIFDEGDRAFRAARGNGGLVWVSGKGAGFLPYMHWTRRSADLWPEFSRAVETEGSVNLAYQKQGGLMYCVGDAEFDARGAAGQKMRAQLATYDFEMLERSAVERLQPLARLGAEVTGAAFGPHDGVCNPLALLRGLHAAMARRGADFFSGAPVKSVQHQSNRYLIEAGGQRIEAGKVVLAAGHGNKALAPSLGLPAPIIPQRGQMMVTERLAPMLSLPGGGLRQTREGTVTIGASTEDVGMNDDTTVAAGASLAARTLRILPALARARLVRTWGCLRVLTPDGHPVYAESPTCPGAFIAICHSGITLAAAHAEGLAESIAAGRLSDFLQAFHAERFNNNVQVASVH